MNTEQKAAEHTGVAAVVDDVKVAVDDVRERFTHEWDSLRDRAKAAFTKLSEEDLEGVKGRFEELRQKVVKAYGWAEEHAHAEVAKLLHRGEEPAKKPAQASAPAPTGTPSRKKNRGAKRHARQAAR